MYAEMGEGKVKGFNSRLITVEDRQRLGDELVAARRSMDVLRTDNGGGGEREVKGKKEGAGEGGEGEGGASEERLGGVKEGEGLSEEDRLLEEKEAKAIASVLNAGPIATRDAVGLCTS
jgi:hypothetical protein